MRYRPLDFSRGGRVTAVTGVPAQPLVYYFGSTGGGVWKTTDAGVTWRNVSDGSFEAGSIGAITVADSDPNVIYVGTGSACPRNNASVGVGMYRSRDGGRTWIHAGLRDAGQIGRIRVDPADPNLVHRRARQRLRPQRSAWRFSLEERGRHLGTCPLPERSDRRDRSRSRPEVSAGALRRRCGRSIASLGVTSTSRDAGIYKSDDGGDTWRRLTRAAV